MRDKTPPLHLPGEIIDSIFHALALHFAEKPSVDPYLHLATPPKFSFISSSSAPVFSPSLLDSALDNFYNCSLVCRDWNAAARPYLFKVMRIGLPRSFETLLDNIADTEEDEREGRFINYPGLPTPPDSRDASPERGLPEGLRRLSLAQTAEKMFSFGAALQATVSNSTGMERYRRDAANPGLLISLLTFSSFRTTSMRRTGREGSQQRFVTPNRLLRLLRGTRAHGDLRSGMIDPKHQVVIPEDGEEEQLRGRLRALGLSEYMDSALNLSMLEELLLRGGIDAVYEQADGTFTTKREGSTVAKDCTPLEALDFCGCVSRIFIEGLHQLIATYRLGKGHYADPNSGWIRSYFPHLKRLGMYDAGIRADILLPFVTSFPSLTHLDLGKTRANPALLYALAETSTLQLEALSLHRCKGIDGDSLMRLLCPPSDKHCVTAKLRHLSINGDENLTPLSEDQLRELFQTAPCLNSGLLVTLDLSSCRLTDEILNLFPASNWPDGKLMVLGLARCRGITLPGVVNLLENRASSVEVLDLCKSCVDPNMRVRPGQLPHVNIMALHTGLITKLAHGTLGAGRTRKTNLRVIELEEAGLDAIKGGAHDWRVIFGKGRRGWYVDLSTTGRFDQGQRVIQDLPSESDERRALLKLHRTGAEDGRVGWNPLKMEVLQGFGSLGNEQGLYGFHSYQY